MELPFDRLRATSGRFTLVELLVVIAIIAILAQIMCEAQYGSWGSTFGYNVLFNADFRVK